MTNQPNNSKKRIDWIDQIKGLAILGIMLFHFFQNYPERLPLVVMLDKLGAKVGFAAVDIFFVIAGFNITYILARKHQLPAINYNWKSWLIKRFDRLYPTYLLAVLFSLTLYFIFGNYQKYIFPIVPDFILSAVGLAGYTFQSINPGFWFFTVILQAYIITPIIISICKSKPARILLLGITLGVLTKVICFHTNSDSKLYWYLLQNDFLGSYFFPFSLGLYWGIIYFARNSFRKIDYWWTSILFAIGLAIYGYLSKSGINFRYMLGFDMVFTPFFIIALQTSFEFLGEPIRSRKLISWILSVFSFLGVYSYQLYLIHQPLYFIIFRKLNAYLSMPSYLKIGVFMIIVVVVLSIYGYLFVFCDNQIRKIMKGWSN